MAEESGRSATESTPLHEVPVDTWSLNDLRRRAEALPKVDEYTFFEYENSPCRMLFTNLAMAFLNSATVAGGYFFLLAAGASVTPRCYLYHDRSEDSFIPKSSDSETWEEWLCNTCTFCFWTYPLIGMLVIVFIFRKNMLDARLYYECLNHGLLLDFRNMQCAYSPWFWLLVLYGILGAGSLFYMKSASASSNKTYRELVYGLLAYLAPCAAFVFVLCTQWSVEWHTVPLIKYCERDHRGAIRHLDRSLVVHETAFVDAFDAAEDLLDRYEQQNSLSRPVELTTKEFVLLILDMVKLKASPPRGWCCGCRCGCGYWVSRVLHSKHLVDTRSWAFKGVVKVYSVFIFLTVLVFIWTLLWVGHELLVLQKVLPKPLPLGPSPHWLIDKMR